MLSAVQRSALMATACLSLLCGGARAADLHVPGDHPDIQSAIDAAQGGDVIHVGPGTWLGALLVVGKTLTIEGAGAEATILHGLGAARALHVTSLPGIPADVVLRDATLTGGVDGAQADLPGTLTLVDCIVRDNTGVGAGGAVTATSSAFLDNGSHGLSDFKEATACSFEGNGGWGAIDLDGTLSQTSIAPLVLGCRFLGNGLGGLRLFANSSSSFFPSRAAVWSSVFLGENAQLSASVAGGTGEIIVHGCSFLDGSLKIMQGHADVTSCILRGPAPIVGPSAPASAKVTYTNIEGLWPFPFDPAENHNVDADPLWAAPEAGDFSLLPGSPCINTGDPQWAGDPDGSPPDMGAVAYHPWTGLGGGIAGSTGVAGLQGDGPLIAGEPLGLTLRDAPADAAALLVVGTAALGAPFKGGVLWPQPDAVLGPFVVPGSGELPLQGSWPAGLPAGFSFWSQAWWPDAAAVQGLAASNGLKGTQP
jgi:hypothetical protein